ncbi:hypothetical protein MGN70_002197 [Eutypa lata]|nr:hypothetical protein MGN70_002197 [Eutypa lata]
MRSLMVSSNNEFGEVLGLKWVLRPYNQIFRIVTTASQMVRGDLEHGYWTQIDDIEDLADIAVRLLEASHYKTLIFKRPRRSRQTESHRDSSAAGTTQEKASNTIIRQSIITRACNMTDDLGRQVAPVLHARFDVFKAVKTQEYAMAVN